MRAPYRGHIQRIRTRGGNIGKMRATVRQIGRAIRRASVYLPIRNLAARVAARAAPKDFLGQLENIYTDFLGRWRYVRDPVSRELVTASPEAIYRLVLAGDGVGMGEGLGAGDCDCATVALGALLESTGFPVRLGTTANAQPGPLFGHVFIQAHVPQKGWVTLDPVLHRAGMHPKKKFGSVAKHSRIAYWDLNGRLVRSQGNVRGLHGESEMPYYTADLPPIDQWQDQGLAFSGIGYAEEEGMPEDWETVGPIGFGNAVGEYGMIDGAALAGIGVEVDDEGTGYARTPMLEVSPDDYTYMSFVGRPYHGMFALGDDGAIYSYDGTFGRGFFKRLFKKVRRGIRKVGRRIKRGIKKVLKKTKFGRWLIKVGGKIKRIAMKIVRPLVKFVGKWASKLAPIAALIPGYGTAIAAGLAAAGKIAKMMQKYGVTTKGKKGKVRGLKLKNPKNLPQFQKALRAEAEKMKSQARHNPAAFKAMLAKQQRRLRAG
jgi:hypothetical protein